MVRYYYFKCLFHMRSLHSSWCYFTVLEMFDTHEECVSSKAALRMFHCYTSFCMSLLCNTVPILMYYCLENSSQGKSIKLS